MIKLCLFLILLAGCSTKINRQNISEKDPLWLYSPSLGCESFEICATGEGSDFNESDASARKSMASIFSVRISSKLEVLKSEYAYKKQIEINEQVESNLTEQVDLVLKGAQIQQRFEKKSRSFSLIKIDKRVVKRIFLERLKEVDKRLKKIVNDANRINLREAYILFTQREVLNEKVIVLDAKGIDSRISHSEIEKLKYDQTYSNKVHLNFSESIPVFIKGEIQENLTDIGYHLVAEGGADYKIEVELKQKEEYIKVEGFKKYSFELSLNVKKFNEQIGKLSVKTVQSGRSLKDAFLKAQSELIEQFEQNIQKLKMN